MATATRPRTTTGTLSLTISRENLLEGLAAVTPSTPTKTTLPVLGNLLLETTDRGLRLSGTDLDIGVVAEVVADVGGSGAITVPAKRLLAIAKELPPAPVRFMAKGDSQVIIDCGRSHFKLQTLGKDEFPAMPAIDFDGPTWRLKAGDLQSLARRSTFATSGEASRPTLHGVLVHLNGSVARFVATDGHVLAVLDRTTENVGEEAEIIVPAKAFDHISRLFDGDEEVEIARGENHLGFRSDTRQVFTRLIEGPYPNYRQVIPKDHKRTAEVDRHALISCVRRMVPIATSEAHRMKLVFKPGKLELSAITPDIGEGSDELAIKLEGDGVTTAVNTSYLLDVLTRIDTDMVSIRTSAPERAIVIRDVPESETAFTLFLIMPLRVLE